jgi:EmrB/QacA subfamily drug resistance transporter
MQRKWWTLLAVCTATFMLLLDITIVNVALPAIQEDLGASFDELQWVIDAYALMLAALLLTAGSLADLLGRRRVFVGGLAIFTVSSLLCGLAHDATLLDLARGVQGIGGAVMFATSLALIAQEFQGRERGVAFGAWGATTGAAVAVGPLVGGALTEVSWQWIFYLNLPIGVACIAVSLLRLAETRDPDARGVDWPGVLTFSAALFMLVFALIRGNDEGWGSAPIVSLLIGSAVLLALFLLVERRRKRPMFDLSLFAKPTFVGASIVAFALSASMFAMFLYITLYIQNILGYSPLEAGVRFLPVTLLSFLVAAPAGRLSENLPKRAFFGLGLARVGGGLLWMGHAFTGGLSTSSDWTDLLGGFIVAGAGIGMINPPLASTAIGVVAPQRSGMASGINSTFRQVGIATGIAGLGAVFQHQVQSHAAPKLAAVASLPHAAAERISEALANGAPAQGIRAPQAEAVARIARESFVSGLNELFVIAGVVALVGAALGLWLVRSADFVVTGAPEPAPAA